MKKTSSINDHFHMYDGGIRGGIQKGVGYVDGRRLYFGDSNESYIEYTSGGDWQFITVGSDDIMFLMSDDLIIYNAAWAEVIRFRNERCLQFPILAGAAGATNGMMWMENDGLHIYYNGAEKVVAGV